MAKNPIIRFFDFLANMGIMVRDDPPKVIDVAARTWGEAAGDFALSIEPMPAEPDTPPTLSVVLRNVGPVARKFMVPGWLHFYRIEIDAELSPFGRRQLKPERATERIPVSLRPGEPVDTQIPLGTLYTLRRGGRHRILVSCTAPGGETVVSNALSISV